MERDEYLAGEFEEHRDHLKAVAYRMLGSVPEAEDAVQEAWLRLHRSDDEGSEPGRLAHDRGGPGLARHAPCPAGEARGNLRGGAAAGAGGRA